MPITLKKIPTRPTTSSSAPSTANGLPKLAPAVEAKKVMLPSYRAQKPRTIPPSPHPGDLALLKQEPPSVVRAINEVLGTRDEDYRFFRPSMLHGCDRANVFHHLRAPMNQPQIGAMLHKVLDNGTAIHSVIQGYLADHPGLFFAPETKVYLPELHIRGSCDGVLTERKTGYRWGLEVKTINKRDFEKLTGPLEKHVAQASIYARLTGVWWITILYWSKDGGHSLREYHVPYDPARWEALTARAKELYGYVRAFEESGEDPDTLPAFDQAVCDDNLKFCRSSAHCHKLMGKILHRAGPEMY